MAAPNGIPANSPILQPGQPLSGKALYQAAAALAQAQTNPAIKALQQQQAQNQNQTTAAENLTGGYFNSLMNQANAAAGRVSQQGTDLNSQLAQIAGDENTQLQGLGQNATNMLARYSPEAQNGATAGMQSLAQEIARQQGLAAQEEGTQRAFGATQGANYTGLANSQVGTGALKGVEDLNQIAQAGQVKNAPLTDKIAQLIGQQGLLTAGNLAKLRQQEITNAVTEQGLGIKQATLNNTIANDQANQKINAGKLGVAQQNANTSAKNSAFNTNPNAVGSAAWQRVQSLQGKNWSTNPNAVGSPAWARVQAANARGGTGAGSKPLSTLENNTYFKALGKVENAITTWQQQGMKDKTGKVTVAHPTDAQMQQVLGGTYDPTMIRAAFELLGWGHLTPQTASALHNMGVRGGTFRGKPIQVAPAPQQAPSSVGNFAPIAAGVQGAVSGAVQGLGG